MFKNIVWRSQIRSVFASRPFRSSIINFKPISLYTHRIRNFSTIDSSGENVDTPPVDPLLLELSSLKLENIKLQGDIKDLKDKILRVYADEENVRRIAKKDVENAKSYANSKFAKSMLDVADNLERALQNTNTELANQGENPAVKNLLTGLEMTYAELEKVFKANGVLKVALKYIITVLIIILVWCYWRDFQS